LTINIAGSLGMGLAAGYFILRGISILTAVSDDWHPRRLHHIFSFSLETALLYERGELALMAVYTLASVLVSVSALFGGLWAMRSLLS
jgi:fluoride exporter